MNNIQATTEDESTIELQGQLLLIYKRNVENPSFIESLNIVLKGQWKLSGNSSESQDFIYKKTWNERAGNMEVTNSDLLKELFYEASCIDMIDDSIG